MAWGDMRGGGYRHMDTYMKGFSVMATEACFLRDIDFKFTLYMETSTRGSLTM
jgi:hypothetical protein